MAPDAAIIFIAAHHGYVAENGLNQFTFWLFNIAMENGPFIDGLPGFTY